MKRSAPILLFEYGLIMQCTHWPGLALWRSVPRWAIHFAATVHWLPTGLRRSKIRLLQELHPCGAETLYMDPDYLQEIVKGLVRVHVRSAAGLQPHGEKQECNAFVTVAVGPSAGQRPMLGASNSIIPLRNLKIPYMSCFIHLLQNNASNQDWAVCYQAME